MGLGHFYVPNARGEQKIGWIHNSPEEGRLICQIWGLIVLFGGEK
jgi:hypothetical protein